MIIDDEKHAIITLQHLLKKITDVEIVAAIQDSTQAKKQIETLRPDIVFLDIEMPELNGFELLNQFEELPFKVIFTTAYDQYAVKALKLNALDYLLKPVEKQELEEAIEKYRKNELFSTSEQIAQVNKFNISQLSETLALSTQKGLFFIKIKEIMYLEADASYTQIVMQNGDKHLVTKPLSNFEEVLQDDSAFFRSHKSHLVNLNFIKQYVRGEGGELIMQDGKSMVLSRAKKLEFLSFFKKI